jgi:hypothetical protein
MDLHTVPLGHFFNQVDEVFVIPAVFKNRAPLDAARGHMVPTAGNVNS